MTTRIALISDSARPPRRLEQPGHLLVGEELLVGAGEVDNPDQVGAVRRARPGGRARPGQRTRPGIRARQGFVPAIRPGEVRGHGLDGGTLRRREDVQRPRVYVRGASDLEALVEAGQLL